MSFNNIIRKIEGGVRINFLANTLDNDVEISETSRGANDVFRPHLKNLFDLDFDAQTKRIAFPSDDGTPNDEKCRAVLAEGAGTNTNVCYPLGENSKVGWYGQERSDSISKGLTATYLKITFKTPCGIRYLTVKGDKGEYPEVLKLQYKYDRAPFTGEEVISYDSSNPRFEIHPDQLVVELTVCITKWSKPKTFAKLSCLFGDLMVDFKGDKIKSISVLEEKTGDLEKLSYGISSNYCNVQILNERQKYLAPENHRLLRKNRSVDPYVLCDGTEYPLGRFYSEEWKED